MLLLINAIELQLLVVFGKILHSVYLLKNTDDGCW